MKIAFVKCDYEVANGIISFEKELLKGKGLSNLEMVDLEMPLSNVSEIDKIFVFSQDNTSIDYLKSENILYSTFNETFGYVDDTGKRIHQVVLEMYKETLTKYVVYNVMPDNSIKEYVVDELEEKQLGNAFRNEEDAIKAVRCRIEQRIAYSRKQIEDFYISIQNELDKISKFEEMLTGYEHYMEEPETEKDSERITYAYDVKLENGTKQERVEVSFSMKEYEEAMRNAIVVNLASTVKTSKN